MDVQALPPSIFKMGNLRLLNADRNHLVELPKKVSVCVCVCVCVCLYHHVCLIVHAPAHVWYVVCLSVRLTHVASCSDRLLIGICKCQTNVA